MMVVVVVVICWWWYGKRCIAIVFIANHRLTKEKEKKEALNVFVIRFMKTSYHILLSDCIHGLFGLSGISCVSRLLVFFVNFRLRAKALRMVYIALMLVAYRRGKTIGLARLITLATAIRWKTFRIQNQRTGLISVMQNAENTRHNATHLENSFHETYFS